MDITVSNSWSYPPIGSLDNMFTIQRRSSVTAQNKVCITYSDLVFFFFVGVFFVCLPFFFFFFPYRKSEGWYGKERKEVTLIIPRHLGRTGRKLTRVSAVTFDF